MALVWPFNTGFTVQVSLEGNYDYSPPPQYSDWWAKPPNNRKIQEQPFFLDTNVTTEGKKNNTFVCQFGLVKHILLCIAT